jgi:hypothetical protein
MNDLLNYSGNKTNIEFSLPSPNSRSLVGIAVEDIKAGEELTQEYADSWCDMVARYGFVENGKPMSGDVVSFDKNDLAAGVGVKVEQVEERLRVMQMCGLLDESPWYGVDTMTVEVKCAPEDEEGVGGGMWELLGAVAMCGVPEQTWANAVKDIHKADKKSDEKKKKAADDEDEDEDEDAMSEESDEEDGFDEEEVAVNVVAKLSGIASDVLNLAVKEARDDIAAQGEEERVAEREARKEDKEEGSDSGEDSDSSASVEEEEEAELEDSEDESMDSSEDEGPARKRPKKTNVINSDDDEDDDEDSDEDERILPRRRAAEKVATYEDPSESEDDSEEDDEEEDGGEEEEGGEKAGGEEAGGEEAGGEKAAAGGEEAGGEEAGGEEAGGEEEEEEEEEESDSDAEAEISNASESEESENSDEESDEEERFVRPAKRKAQKLAKAREEAERVLPKRGASVVKTNKSYVEKDESDLEPDDEDSDDEDADPVLWPILLTTSKLLTKEVVVKTLAVIDARRSKLPNLEREECWRFGGTILDMAKQIVKVETMILNGCERQAKSI